ncbi:MAG TPA: PEP/pyruvate-binding domain-containing protein, partial [Verrucomicrobiota bacterium]|nr:PEP/pyruvate-binding domain-containing protein [Verrucomicrobiota bacterium]
MSSGMAGLDRVLQGLLPGDNVVWEVEEVADYAPVLPPFAAEARRLGRRLVYFRFARHEPLLEAGCGAEIHVLHPQEGFERFLTGILDIIESVGPGAFYVFDCLSDLAADWYSDRMLGNFFMIACPYLYELDTLAYFALLKSQHSFQAIHAIVQTAQVIIEVYRTDSRLYIHPQKVWQRYSPSMYSLHRWEGDQFLPVTSSATITDILTSVSRPSLEFTVSRPGIWLQTFQQARDLLAEFEAGRASAEDARRLFARVVKMVLTRDERFLALAEEYFHLADLVGVMQRMVGTGLVGGKSLGMLLARAILRKADPRWEQRLESHDSFYVGSDVFYTYLVQNGCWWLRRRQKDFATYLRRAEEARQKILAGTFPEVIQNQFMEMLEYFGQSPLIVRSSSLLEDNYGNAFSGKYESVFLANQGSPQDRLTAFLQAVRTVYASTMSEEGLRYRLHHGLLDRDEQMALLVQRVSGELCGSLFFPHLAGVGLSFNPFVWSQEIDPEAGMLRLVFGLGTRAVDRNEDDYTRLVALNAPRR